MQLPFSRYMVFTIRGGSKGGLEGSSPPTADASMKNREGEGEEVVEERRKMERKRGRRRKQLPLSPMKILSLELRKKTLDTR
jgi:hypothetical protein